MRSERICIMNLQSWFVCLMGMSVVFLGLICLILLCLTVRLFAANPKPVKKEEKQSAPTPTEAPVVAVAPAVTTPIENRAEIIAAVSAALAEELGEEVSSIRILSFRKIGG